MKGKISTQNFIPNSKVLFIIILTIQLAAMLIMSQQVGISADERRHIAHAEKVYNFYKSGGEDKAALEKTGIDPMQYNGQSFDNLMFLIEKTFHVENNMEMRHFFNALIGWLVILLAGLIAKELWGYQGAIIAILLLFFTPRFLGHALNNNKDIPFALGFILSFYAMMLLFKQMPKPKLKTMLLLTLGIGIAISIRLAGLLSIAFLGLFGAIYFFSRKPIFGLLKKDKLTILKRLALIIPLVSIAGYFIGIVFWPFMMEAPIENINVILDATTSHPVSLNQLYNGELIQSSKLPHSYALKYMLLTYPIVILLGLGLFTILLPFNFKKEKLFNYFVIAFAFVFVFTWMSLKNSNFYGGIRHLLFIYPLAVCLTVLGIKFLYNTVDRLNAKWPKAVVTILLIGLSLPPVVHIIKNYPYSYVYFNELAGGVKKAYNKYETDYFQHSLRHATEWFKENELPNLMNDTSKVKLVSNDNFNTGYYLRDVKEKVECNYTRYYNKFVEEWDYAIFYCGYISPNQITENLWPPKGTIHTENVDGFPIAAVVKRISYEDIKGFNAVKEKKYEVAKNHFQNFLKVYPESEQVLEGYGRIMMIQRTYDSAHYYSDLSLKFNPRQMGALLTKASVFNMQKEYKKALESSNRMLEIKATYAEAHYQKGFALKQLNKPNEALKSFQLAANNKEDYYLSHMQVAQIFMNYKNYKKAVEVYKIILKFKENDFRTTINLAKCHSLLNDNKKAEQLLQSLPQQYQNNFDVVKVRCRIALSKNDMNKASRYIQMARNINNNSELYVLRAMYATNLNRKDLATEYINKALELDKLNREAQEFKKKLTAKPTKQVQQPANSQQSIMYQKQQKKKSTSIGILGK